MEDIMLKITAIIMLIFLISSSAMAGAAEDLNTAVQNWNAYFGQNVVCNGWSYAGVISNEAERNAVVAQMTNPQSTYIVDGDAEDPATITAVLLGTGSPEHIAEWNAMVDSLIQIGQYIAVVNWQFVGSQATFTSLTAATVNEIVFDPMFSCISIVEVDKLNGSDRTMTWIWGGTRGKAWWWVDCKETSDTIVCEYECDAWYTLGSAACSCQVKRTGRTCILAWAYGWHTPIGDIEFGFDTAGFKMGVSVSGLGSEGSGSGQLIDTCPPNPDTAQVIDRQPVNKCCLNPGDADHNGIVNVLDVVFLVDYIYNKSRVLMCYDEGDVDSSGSINILDISYLIRFLYENGPPPRCPKY
jgi:hypothetical protein